MDKEMRTIQIVLIEEDPRDAALIEGMLRQEDWPPFRVQQLPQMPVTAEKLASQNADVLLWSMPAPGEREFELLSEMSACLPRLACIVLGNTDAPDLAVEILERGAQDFLDRRHLTAKNLKRAILFAVLRARSARTFQPEISLARGKNPGQLESELRQGTNGLAETDLPSGRNVNGHYQFDQALQRRLDFGQVLTKISTHLVTFSDFDRAVLDTLRDVGLLTHASRARLYLLRGNENLLDNTHEWCAEGVSSQINNSQGLRTPDFPWSASELQRGTPLSIEDVSELPDEVESIRARLLAQGTRAVLLFPICVESQMQGLLGLDYVVPKPAWHKEEVELLKIVTQIIGRILQHQGMQEDLATQVTFLKHVIDLNPSLIFAKDRDGRFTLVNQAFADVYGRPVEELIGKTECDFNPHIEEVEERHQDDLELIDTLCGKTIPEDRRTDAEGRTHWLFTVKQPLMDADGRFNQLLCVATDITELKRAQEALERERNLLRNLIDSIPASVYIKDAESRFITGNAWVARLMGAEVPDQLVGKTDFDFYPRQLAAAYAADEQQVIQTGQSLIDRIEPIQDPAGNTFWYSTSKVLLRDNQGNVTGTIGIGLDITQRKLMEEALQRNEEHLRSIFQNAAIGIATVTLKDGRYVEANPALQAMLGYDIDELKQKTWADVTHPEDVDKDWQLRRSIINGEHSSGQIEKRYTRKDGTFLWARLTVSLVRGPEGQPQFLVGMVEDITQGKQDELEKEHLQAQFLQAQKMEAVGRLTAGIAHDFNNLLTAINGFAQMLQLNLPSGDPRRDYADNILASGRRASELVRQLMVFSRKEIKRPQVVCLNYIVTDVDKMLRRVIGEDVRLERVLAPDLGMVRADPSQIEQIIVNLAVNARDAMPDGGQLTIETSNLYIDEAYAAAHLGVAAGDYVLLALTDTGVGMDQEVKEHLFEPFFTTKTRSKGTGLGLATVYGIVQQHKGHIWVYSEPGMGTTFKIYLPRTCETPRQADVAVQPVGLVGGSETILLVEDDLTVLELAQHLLKEQGYRMLQASNGLEALEVAEAYQGTIHLLLTDVVMPGMNGKQLANQLRLRFPHLKILFMSGYADEAIKRHKLSEMEAGFLEKPFVPATLARKVRHILDA